MSHFIHTETDLNAAIRRLIKAEPRFAPVFDVTGQPPLRRRPGGFGGLAMIVVGQQLSGASAAAIWGRLSASIEPFEPEAVLRARADKLRRVGLSGSKVRTLKAIAKAAKAGDLDFGALGTFTADNAHEILIAVHGIGPWTASNYLLACIGHSDAWPAGDLALQEAARIAFKLKTRPSTRDMDTLAEPWRPWRSVAARLLWSYYRAVKGLDGAPMQASTKMQAPAREPNRNGRRARRPAT
jgi:DNA-3-methyladenine glycosylase II